MDEFSKSDLFRRLAKERQMTSLIEKEIVAEGSDFMFERSNWVPLYYDTGSKVVSDDGRQTAYRAITTRGELLWFVFTKGKEHGFHAETTCPFAAFEAATDSLQRRRQIKGHWADITALAARVRLGKQTMTVTLEDAHASPLCSMGIRYFLRTIGMPNAQGLPCKLAAWLMLVEPQLGYVFYQAAVRQDVLVPATRLPIEQLS